MMLGEPVAMVAEPVGSPCEVERLPDRLRRRLAFPDGGLVQDAQSEDARAVGSSFAHPPSLARGRASFQVTSTWRRMLEFAGGPRVAGIRRRMSRETSTTRRARARGRPACPLSGSPRRAGRRLRRTLVLLTAAATLATLPISSSAQWGSSLRLFDRPSLLDDGDVGSLRTAVAQSLSWLDRQPPGRVLVFGTRRVTYADYATGLRRFLMLLAGNPPPEVLEERILTEFEVLSSVGRTDGSVLLTGYHEPVIAVSERPSPEYSVPVLGLPPD